MKREIQAEIDVMVRELRARNSVLEAVQTQLMLRLASIFDSPQEFVRLIMKDAEENLRRGRDEATGDDKLIAGEAVSVCHNYSLRLIAALTPKEKNPH